MGESKKLYLWMFNLFKLQKYIKCDANLHTTELEYIGDKWVKVGT